MADVEQQYQQIPAEEGTEAAKPVSNVNGRWVKVGSALLGVSCLAFLFTTMSSPTSAEANDVEFAALCARTSGAACAKELTENYLDKRFANDVKGLEGLLSKDAKLTVDLSDAGWLVPAKIHYAMSFKDEQVGPSNVGTFFQKLPCESGDVEPEGKDIKCTDDECVITAHVSRPFIGKITDVGTLDWDLDTKKLKTIHSKFSV